MKTSRRKLFTAIVSLALVVMIGAGAIVAVFAALVAHVESGFNISYTASNVECVVSGTYTQKYGKKDASLGEDIHFTLADQDNVAKSFTEAPSIEFENYSDYVEFHYTIQNLGKNSFNVSLSQTGLNNPAFKVEYTRNVRASGDETPKFDFSNSKVRLMDCYVTEQGGPKESLDIGIRISLIGKPTESANVEGSFNFTLDGLALPPTDIWDDDIKQFDKANLDTLLKLISGDAEASTTNMAQVDSLATQRTSAAQMRMFNAEKESDTNIVVWLGGLSWHACYLSKDKQGNIILTLWLTSSQQKMFEGLPADAGDYYGFVDGSLYSNWSAWEETSNEYINKYPSNLYGASYMRAVTLNNGGPYSIASRDLSGENFQNPQSVFSLFTMEEFGLTQYLTTPRNVSWQEDEQLAKDMVNMDYNFPNENWSTTMSSDGYSSNYSYMDKERYDAWADDFLWLPSLTETGRLSGTHGFWGLDVSQRMNGNLRITNDRDTIGKTNRAGYYSHFWLRTGVNSSGKVGALGTSTGEWLTGGTSLRACYAVRPALHLNLTAAVAAVNAE